MARVLIYTSPALGHLYPVVDLAVALREAGHEPILHTLAAAAPDLQAAGLKHRPLDPAIEALPLDDYLGGSPPAQLRRTLNRWAQRAPLDAIDLARAHHDTDADLLVVDANAWGAAAYAESLGRPWAMTLPYVLPVPDPLVPAFGMGFPPPRNALHRLRDALARGVTNRIAAAPLAALNRLRAGLRLGPLRTLAELYLSADLLLHRTAGPFSDLRARPLTKVHAIGPGLWAPPAPAPAWLTDLPRPRTLVSVSTERQQDDAIVRTALQALAGVDGSAIVTTAACDPQTFHAPHERVRIERFLSHAAIVPEMDVVVTHGGMGTTQRALAAGVPVVVVPWGRDQADTGRRVAEAGAGVVVPRNRLTPARLQAAVREARSRREGARAVADAFRRAGGPARGVALLQGLLSEPRPAGRHSAVNDASETGAVVAPAVRQAL